MVEYPADPSRDVQPTHIAHFAFPIEAEWTAREAPAPGQWPRLLMQVGAPSPCPPTAAAGCLPPPCPLALAGCPSPPCPWAPIPCVSQCNNSAGLLTCSVASSNGASTSRPVGYPPPAPPPTLQVCSYDRWDRGTTEGYGWLQLGPATCPGSNVHYVPCWKPQGRCSAHRVSCTFGHYGRAPGTAHARWGAGHRSTASAATKLHSEAGATESHPCPAGVQAAAATRHGPSSLAR